MEYWYNSAKMERGLNYNDSKERRPKRMQKLESALSLQQHNESISNDHPGANFTNCQPTYKKRTSWFQIRKKLYGSH